MKPDQPDQYFYFKLSKDGAGYIHNRESLKKKDSPLFIGDKNEMKKVISDLVLKKNTITAYNLLSFTPSSSTMILKYESTIDYGHPERDRNKKKTE